MVCLSSGGGGNGSCNSRALGGHNLVLSLTYTFPGLKFRNHESNVSGAPCNGANRGAVLASAAGFSVIVLNRLMFVAFFPVCAKAMESRWDWKLIENNNFTLCATCVYFC